MDKRSISALLSSPGKISALLVHTNPSRKRGRKGAGLRREENGLGTARRVKRSDGGAINRDFHSASVKVYLVTGVERKSRDHSIRDRGGGREREREREEPVSTYHSVCPYHFLCPPSGHRVLVTVVHAALLFHYLLIHFAIRQRNTRLPARHILLRLENRLHESSHPFVVANKPCLSPFLSIYFAKVMETGAETSIACSDHPPA